MGSCVLQIVELFDKAVEEKVGAMIKSVVRPEAFNYDKGDDMESN